MDKAEIECNLQHWEGEGKEVSDGRGKNPQYLGLLLEMFEV